MCADFPSNVIIKITGLGSPHTHLSHLYQKDFAVAKTFMSPIMSYLEAALKLPFFFFLFTTSQGFYCFPHLVKRKKKKGNRMGNIKHSKF